MGPEKHTSTAFDNELQEATKLFLSMGEIASNQVAQAIHALVTNDRELADQVIQDDDIVNDLEIKIDDLVMKLVLKRQPAANDFRYVMAMSKGVLDIERIGDEASKIARKAKSLSNTNSTLGHPEAQHLSEQVRVMIHNALDAFKSFNSDQAIEVVRSDKVINKEYRASNRALIEHIMADSQTANEMLDLMRILRALERIGDHAKNIAELVIYATCGTDIRHADIDDIEQIIQDRQP